MKKMYDKDILQKIQKVGDGFDDELSKTIFWYRLLANLTGDERYIHQLVDITGCVDVYAADKLWESTNRDLDGIYPSMDVLCWLLKNDYKKSPVVMFGAGSQAKFYISFLSLIHLKPEVILDNNVNIRSLEGIPVISPRRYGRLVDALVIITSDNYKMEMREEMLELGVDSAHLFIPDINARWVYSDKQYFDESVFPRREEGIFVDGGAFNMQTAYHFIKWAKAYKNIYSFEPDVIQYEVCQRRINAVNIPNTTLLHFGLYHSRQERLFAHEGTGGSSISDRGENVIVTEALDRVLGNENVTYIKMDIEGAEIPALYGAKQIISSQRPRLAICVYHKPQDIYDIMLLLNEWVPEYRFKLRQYSTFFWETVLYAYIE